MALLHGYVREAIKEDKEREGDDRVVRHRRDDEPTVAEGGGGAGRFTYAKTRRLGANFCEIWSITFPLRSQRGYRGSIERGAPINAWHGYANYGPVAAPFAWVIGVITK